MWIEKKKNRKRRILMVIYALILLIAITTIINIIGGRSFQFKSFSNFIKANSYGFSIGFAYWIANYAVGSLVAKRLNWKKSPSKANMILLLSFIGAGMIMSLVVPFIFLKYVWHVPQDRMQEAVLGHGFMAMAVDMIVVSIYYSRYLVRYWGQSIKEKEDLKHETLLAKYEALKNQVNPHFLFNTLNTLTGVVEQQPHMATKFIRKLSDIYRYVLEQKDKELVLVASEKAFVNDYIFLLKMRHGNGLIMHDIISAQDKFTVPLGLQILVENAIKHNIISDDEPLTIEMGNKNGYLYVKNNLQRKNLVNKSSKMGLENLVSRYEYVASKPVQINETNEYFEVKLPLLETIES